MELVARGYHSLTLFDSVAKKDPSLAALYADLLASLAIENDKVTMAKASKGWAALKKLCESSNKALLGELPWFISCLSSDGNTGIIEAIGWDNLLNAVKSSKDGGVTMLGILSINDDHGGRIVDELYNYLFELGKSPKDKDVWVEVAAALGCLALAKNGAVQLAKNGVYPILVEFIASKNPTLRREGIFLARNLALSSVPRVWDHLLKKGLVDLLAPCTVDNDELPVEERAACVVTISRIADSSDKVLQLLGSWLDSNDVLLLFGACYAYASLAVTKATELTQKQPDLVAKLTILAKRPSSGLPLELDIVNEANSALSKLGGPAVPSRPPPPSVAPPAPGSPPPSLPSSTPPAPSGPPPSSASPPTSDAPAPAPLPKPVAPVPPPRNRAPSIPTTPPPSNGPPPSTPASVPPSAPPSAPPTVPSAPPPASGSAPTAPSPAAAAVVESSHTPRTSRALPRPSPPPSPTPPSVGVPAASPSAAADSQVASPDSARKAPSLPSRPSRPSVVMLPKESDKEKTADAPLSPHTGGNIGGSGFVKNMANSGRIAIPMVPPKRPSVASAPNAVVKERESQLISSSTSELPPVDKPAPSPPAVAAPAPGGVDTTSPTDPVPNNAPSTVAPVAPSDAPAPIPLLKPVAPVPLPRNRAPSIPTTPPPSNGPPPSTPPSVSPSAPPSAPPTVPSAPPSNPSVPPPAPSTVPAINDEEKEPHEEATREVNNAIENKEGKSSGAVTPTDSPQGSPRKDGDSNASSAPGSPTSHSSPASSPLIEHRKEKMPKRRISLKDLRKTISGKSSESEESDDKKDKKTKDKDKSLRKRDSRVAVEGSSEATVAAPSSPTASSPTLTGAVSPVIEAVMKVNELVLTSNGAEADKYLRLLIEHLEKSSPAMTEVAALVCLERLALDFKSYQSQLVTLGILDALSHQLDSGADELVVASLKCIAALCSNFDNNASTRDQVLDHKLISNHLKNLLATDSALWVRISRPLAEIVRGSKKAVGEKQYNAMAKFAFVALPTELKSFCPLIDAVCEDNSKAQDAFRHSKAVAKLTEQLLQKTDDVDFSANILIALNGLCIGNAKNADEVSKVKGFVSGLVALKLSSTPVASAVAHLIWTLCQDKKRRKTLAEGGSLKTALSGITLNSADATDLVQRALKALEDS